MTDPTAEEANALGQGTSTAAQRTFQAQQDERWDYGGNPLARLWTEGQLSDALPPSAAQLQPGLYKEIEPNRANAAPLGLSGFAFTTFLLSMINLGARGTMTPNGVVGSSLAYGGVIQLCAGMWELGYGNTFAAWALSSYGGFWISLGIVFTPGLFQIMTSYGSMAEFYTAFGFYIYGWFIFTVLVWIATLRSTLIFNLLILTVWLAFLMLATAYVDNIDGVPNHHLVVAGGAFGIVAAFLAWWVMVAGVINKDNSFFTIPVFHFPWSPEGRKRSRKDYDAEKGD